MILLISIIFIIFIAILMTGIFLRMSTSNKPVDFVYTWVEVDSSLQSDMEKYANVDEKRPLSAYRDTNELLYSLRSICLFAPWFHHVYLVVRDGQKPTWINTNCKKITIINIATPSPTSKTYSLSIISFR